MVTGGKKEDIKEKTHHHCQNQTTTQYVFVQDCLNNGHLASSK